MGCTISGNTATVNGGGLDAYGYNNHPSNTSLLNCTISGNTAGNHGGGISNYGAQVTVDDCTVAFNQAGNAGGGIRTAGSSTNPGSTTLFNTLIGDNTAGASPGVGNDLATESNGTVNASFSFIQNGAAAVNGTNTNNVFGQDSQWGRPVGLPQGEGTQTIALLDTSPARNAGGALDTLAADVGNLSSDTTITVNAAFPIPNPPAGTGFPILIGTEEMFVTAVAGTTLTVKRTVFGTSPAGHNQNDPIFLAIDQDDAPGPTPTRTSAPSRPSSPWLTTSSCPSTAWSSPQANLLFGGLLPSAPLPSTQTV